MLILLLAFTCTLSWLAFVLFGFGVWAIASMFFGFGLIFGLEIEQRYPDAQRQRSRCAMPPVEIEHVHNVDWSSDRQTHSAAQS